MEQLPSDSFTFVNNVNRKYADELFKKNGFVVVENFLSKDKIEELVAKLNEENSLSLIGNKNNYHNFYAKYFFLNDNQNTTLKADIFKIAKDVSSIRNKICLQPNSDRMMHSYCQRFNINPENEIELFNHQMGHSFIRIANYRDGQGQIKHRDNPGEIQCIIPLTKYGVDYTKGGLYLINEETGEDETHVDPVVNPGDLILLNSYSKIHRVEPVQCSKEQVGRMHIFLPIVPDYFFSGNTYYFSNSPLKPFFPTKKPRIEKILYSIRHYYMLLTNKNYTPVDRR